MSQEQRTEAASAICVDGDESLWRLLRWLGEAIVARARARMPMRVVHAGITTCGLILMCVPLVLWVAWSIPVLYATLVLGGLAGLVLSILIWLCPEDRI